MVIGRDGKLSVCAIAGTAMAVHVSRAALKIVNLLPLRMMYSLWLNLCCHPRLPNNFDKVAPSHHGVDVRDGSPRTRRQPAIRSWPDRQLPAPAAASTIRGRRMVKVEPRPGSLATTMSPPIIWQNRRLMVSPSPVPPYLLAVAERRLRELLEQPTHLLRRHADAGVGDRERDPVAPVLATLPRAPP